MDMDMDMDMVMAMVAQKNHDGSDALTWVDREANLTWESGSSTFVSAS